MKTRNGRELHGFDRTLVLVDMRKMDSFRTVATFFLVPTRSSKHDA